MPELQEVAGYFPGRTLSEGFTLAERISAISVASITLFTTIGYKLFTAWTMRFKHAPVIGIVSLCILG